MDRAKTPNLDNLKSQYLIDGVNQMRKTSPQLNLRCNAIVVLLEKLVYS